MISNHTEVGERSKTLASFHDWSFLCASSYATHASPSIPLGTILDPRECSPPSSALLFWCLPARPYRRGKLRCPTSDLLVYIVLRTPIDFRVTGERSFRQFPSADSPSPLLRLAFCPPTAPLATFDPYVSPIWKKSNLHGGLSFSGFAVLTSQGHSHPPCHHCGQGMSTSIQMYQKSTL